MIQAEKDKISAAELVRPTGTTSTTDDDVTDDEKKDYSFNDISTIVDYKSKAGADEDEISQYLREMYYAGHITREEWDALRHKYLTNTKGGKSGVGGIVVSGRQVK
jgi:hypothetical protein